MTEQEMQRDIDRILARLEAEMPEAQRRMDELLARLRAPVTADGDGLAPSPQPR